jgi:hypothetical protein
MLFFEKAFAPADVMSAFEVAFLVLLLEVGPNYIGLRELALSTRGLSPANAII